MLLKPTLDADEQESVFLSLKIEEKNHESCKNVSSLRMGFEEKKRVKFSKCFSFAFGYLGEINTFIFPFGNRFTIYLIPSQKNTYKKQD